jgi:hypothetical protein
MNKKNMKHILFINLYHENVLIHMVAAKYLSSTFFQLTTFHISLTKLGLKF